MATKHSPADRESDAHSIPAPKMAAPVITATLVAVSSPPLEPKMLAELAAAIEALKVAKASELRLRADANRANDAHASALAALEARRAGVLKASAALAGGDLADNVLPLTDAEAARLAKDAAAAHRGIPEHVRARLFGSV